ncbi:hypothetical protein BDR03DRAFT_975258 [Suillus americanus]|nr:hypothetical protein BDR03DRAFT_975258 [Suillus americanus]
MAACMMVSSKAVDGARPFIRSFLYGQPYKNPQVHRSSGVLFGWVSAFGGMVVFDSMSSFVIDGRRHTSLSYWHDSYCSSLYILARCMKITVFAFVWSNFMKRALAVPSDVN